MEAVVVAMNVRLRCFSLIALILTPGATSALQPGRTECATTRAADFLPPVRFTVRGPYYILDAVPERSFAVRDDRPAVRITPPLCSEDNVYPFLGFECSVGRDDLPDLPSPPSPLIFWIHMMPWEQDRRARYIAWPSHWPAIMANSFFGLIDSHYFDVEAELTVSRGSGNRFTMPVRFLRDSVSWSTETRYRYEVIGLPAMKIARAMLAGDGPSVDISLRGKGIYIKGSYHAQGTMEQGLKLMLSNCPADERSTCQQGVSDRVTNCYDLH